VTALLFLIGVHSVAQVAQVNSLVSVCVNQSTGAMRMLLGAAAPSPASCSAGEQFLQWVVQTPPGAQRTARPLALNGSKGNNGLRRELIAYYEPQGSGAVNQAQGTTGNSGGSIPPNQRGAYGPNGTFVPVPHNEGANAENTSVLGEVTTVYAPFQVRDRTTGKVLAQIINNGKGGRIQMLDANGTLVATIGTSPAGTGSVAAYHANDVVGLTYPPNARYGALQMFSSGQRVAELAPGVMNQMGLRIFNPSGVEVVTLENLAGGFGGGGLMIHNAIGGSAATIAPNKDGVGIFHGITIPMPLP
jgi:hypothetical protein